LLEAGREFARTESAVLMTGWVPTRERLAVERRVIALTAGRCVLNFKVPRTVPEEQIPVLLRHSRWLQPFIPLVTGFGLPRYRELAPTIWVALSYPVMIGMMFGDVGHGMVLLLAGGAAFLVHGRLRRNGPALPGGKPSGNQRHVNPRADLARTIGSLLIFSGLASVAGGWVYGSFFGLPAWKSHALWHDPLDADPVPLMGAALGLGMLMISLGLVLNILNHLIRRDFLTALLDKFGLAGLLFYWGAAGLLWSSLGREALPISSAGMVTGLGFLVFCWMIKEPLALLHHRRAGHRGHHDHLGTALVEAVVGAFEALLLYLANTVSFVRLAAYALSHAALLLATFIMAAEVERTAGKGAVLALVVIIVGNLGTILLEGTVAAVQALRLEYYEFFGKFFSGSGPPFRGFQVAGEGVSG
jgi:V/A-type H+-transporting ATPase subunit I